MVAPNALRKLDNAYTRHNAAVNSADRRGGASPAAPAVAPAATRPSPGPAPDGLSAAPPRQPAEERMPRTGRSNKRKQNKEPQVVLRNMPGAEMLARKFPAIFEQMEDHFILYPAENGKLRDILITGCAVDSENIRLRIGNDVRKIPREEFRQNFFPRIKWALLTVLAYYTLSFSIFAQTIGMWFWGIFLTRSKVAEVLAFRAAIYAGCMLVFGILMIPMVLITKRSLADWLCGVRQVNVGSASQS